MTVEGGGCSGFQYKFLVEDSPLAEDDKYIRLSFICTVRIHYTVLLTLLLFLLQGVQEGRCVCGGGQHESGAAQGRHGGLPAGADQERIRGGEQPQLRVRLRLRLLLRREELQRKPRTRLAS